MRILHINDYLCQLGGVETYLASLIEAQRARGDEVELFGSDSVGGGRHFAAGNVPPITTDGVHTCRGTSSNSKASRALQQFYNRSAVARARELADNRYDIVHVHGFLGQLSASVLGAFAAAGIPIVLSAHTYKAICPTGSRLLEGERPCTRPWGAACGKSCSVPATAIMAARSLMTPNLRHLPCATLAMGQDVASAYRTAGFNNVVELPIGYARTIPPTSAADPLKRVLFAGKLDRVKGVFDLLESFETFSRQHLDWELRFCGDGPDTRVLRRRAEAGALRGRVSFSGWLTRTALAHEMDNARLFCAPSRVPETAGLVVLDAMAAGLPVVASSVGGYRDTIEHGRNGMLFTPGDTQGLADTLAHLADDPAEAARLSTSGTSSLARYSMESHVRRLDEIYRSCVEQQVEHDRG